MFDSTDSAGSRRSESEADLGRHIKQLGSRLMQTSIDELGEARGLLFAGGVL
jgi:hypothetical protein